jgi:hypothetical protein
VPIRGFFRWYTLGVAQKVVMEMLDGVLGQSGR